MEEAPCFVNFRWNLTCDFMLNSFDMPRSFLSDVSNQSLSKKMGSKKRQNLHKKYSRTAQRGSKRGSQAEISSWQSNKSVKITHLLSWQTKEGISFSFISWLFYDYHMWSIKTSSLIFQVMERTLKTMGLHPTYLEAFKATHDKILSEEVPISALDRHHIALMVSQKLLCMHPWLLYEAKKPNMVRCCFVSIISTVFFKT